MLRKAFKKLMGIDKTEQKAHDMRNQAASDLAQIEIKVREINRYVHELTAYRVAKATGRVK